MCGYTRRANDNSWTYSEKVVSTIGQYMAEYPELFDYLSRSNSNASKDVFHVDDVFAGEGDCELAPARIERLDQLVKWIKEQPSSNAPRQPCGTQTLDEDVVRALEDCVEKSSDSEGKKKVVTMQVYYVSNQCKYHCFSVDLLFSCLGKTSSALQTQFAPRKLNAG